MNRNRVIRTLAIVFTLAILMGCQSKNQPGNTEATVSPAAADSASSSSGTPDFRHQPAASSVPAAPSMETVTVPAGREIPIWLNSGLNTGRTPAGSTFEGSLAAPLIARGVEVARTGSPVTGSVTNVVSSGRLKRPAEISLVLTSITAEGGQPVQISTRTWAIRGKSHKKRDIIAIGGGAGLGAMIGAIAGGGKGAAIGGLAGAGAGTAGAYATGKKEISLPPETRLNFRLSAPATFTVRTAG